MVSGRGRVEPCAATCRPCSAFLCLQDPIEDKYPDESTQAVLRRSRINATQQLARANSRGSGAGHRGRSSPAYDPFLPASSQVGGLSSKSTLFRSLEPVSRRQTRVLPVIALAVRLQFLTVKHNSTALSQAILLVSARGCAFECARNLRSQMTTWHNIGPGWTDDIVRSQSTGCDQSIPIKGFQCPPGIQGAKGRASIPAELPQLQLS